MAGAKHTANRRIDLLESDPLLDHRAKLVANRFVALA